MNLGMYRQLVEIENKHWWFISRQNLIKTILEKLDIDHVEKCLDIGCGVGGNLNFLKSYCNQIIGLDFSDIAIKLAREKWPEFDFNLGDANKLSTLYNANSFDFVTIFNVMYHKWIVSDIDLLRQTYTILKPGGYIILTEPAFMHLWRGHDIQDMGKKRYTLTEINLLLKEAGFKPVVKTYFNSISYLPALFLAFLYKLQPKNKKYNQEEGVSEIEMPGKTMNNIMYTLMRLESSLIKKINTIPFGVSILCVAQKN